MTSKGSSLFRDSSESRSVLILFDSCSTGMIIENLQVSDTNVPLDRLKDLQQVPVEFLNGADMQLLLW